MRELEVETPFIEAWLDFIEEEQNSKGENNVNNSKCN